MWKFNVIKVFLLRLQAGVLAVVLLVVYLGVFGTIRLFVLIFPWVLRHGERRDSAWIKSSGYRMSEEDWFQQS